MSRSTADWYSDYEVLNFEVLFASSRLIESSFGAQMIVMRLSFHRVDSISRARETCSCNKPITSNLRLNIGRKCM